MEIVDTVRKIRDVNPGEGIDPAGVASGAEELGVLTRGRSDVCQVERDGVLVPESAAVPVIRDAFPAAPVGEVAGSPAHGVEGHQDAAVEDPLGMLGGSVGHEAVDEGVGCGPRDGADEGGVEEVGVRGDAVGDPSGAEGGELGQVVVGVCRVLEVDQLLELVQLEVVGLLVEVEIAAGRGVVDLVFVVAVGETFGICRGKEEKLIN